MGLNGAGAPATTGLRPLSRDEILAAPDLAREMVAVPEWGEDRGVLVQALDVNRRLAYYEFVLVRETDSATGERRYQSRDGIHYHSVLAALGIIDEHGEPVFTLADLDELGTKDPAPLARIADVVQRLSRIGGYTVAQAEAPLVQNGASPTASPAPSVA